MSNGPIRVLIITSRADFGGGPEHIYRLLNSLNERIDFFIAAPEDYPYWELYRKLLGDNCLIKIPHRKFSISALWHTGVFCRTNKIGIVHSHGKGAGIYSRLISFLWGIPSVHTFHGLHIQQYSPLQRKLYFWLEKFLALLTTKFISVSKGEMDLVTGSGITAAGRITLIENGTPIPDRTASYDFARRSIPLIASISRFDYAKNTEMLIPVAEELLKFTDEFRFLVIGTGEGFEKFNKEIIEKKLDSYFRLTGAVLNTGDYLINSFCYISTSRWEGLPLGVLEAMSYALPVVATDVTGNNDLIKNDAEGLLFRLNSPADAAAAILKLKNSETDYRRYAAAARKKVKNRYSLSAMAEKTYNLYIDLKNN